MTHIHDLRWQAEDPLAGLTMMITPEFDQRAWRFRYDDGDEAEATWVDVQNEPVTERPTENFRLRFEIQETAGGGANNQTIVLQYNVGLGWNSIGTASAVVRLFASPFVTNGTATTNQLTAGTGGFVPGIVATTASGTDITFAGSDHTEVEWCVQILADDVNDGQTIDFRVTVQGAITNTSTAGNASLTVSKPGRGTFAVSDSTTVEWSGSKPSAGTFAVSDNVTVSWEGFEPPVWAELQTFTNIFTNLYDDSTVVPGEWYRYRVAGALDEEPQSDWSDWVQALAEDTAEIGAASGSGIGTGVASAEVETYGAASGSGVGSGTASAISINDGALHGTARGFGSATGFEQVVIGAASGSGAGLGSASAALIFPAAAAGSGVGSGVASGVESLTPTGTFAVDDSTTVEWSAYRTSTAVFAVSDSVTVEWMGYEPPNPVPTNLTVTPVGSTQLKVDWDSPLSRFTVRREEWSGVGDPP